MALLILGILVLIASFVIQKVYQFARYAKPVRLVAVLLIVAGFITKMIVQIEPGQIGVKTLFGKVQNDVIRSGLHFINPFMEVIRLDVKTQNYTMSGVHDEGAKSNDDAIRVLTADGLEVTIDLTVLYKLLPSEAPSLIKETGQDYTDKIVRPLTRTKIRDNAVYYDAISLYSTKEMNFSNGFLKALMKILRKEV